MECWNVKGKVAAYLDKAVSGSERARMIEHLSECGACSRELERQQRVREAVRSLSQRNPPAELGMRLRVVASKARMELAGGQSGWSRLYDRFRLALNNLMKPLALPFAGGLGSAIVLFSALVPTFTSTFAMNKTSSLWDVPTMLATEPMVKCTAPVAFPAAEAIVDLTIDEQGRIVNYTIVSAAPGQKTEQLRRIIENNLVFMEVWPATAFFRPVAGTIRVSFGVNHVDVRG